MENQELTSLVRDIQSLKKKEEVATERLRFLVDERYRKEQRIREIEKELLKQAEDKIVLENADILKEAKNNE